MQEKWQEYNIWLIVRRQWLSNLYLNVTEQEGSLTMVSVYSLESSFVISRFLNGEILWKWKLTAVVQSRVHAVTVDVCVLSLYFKRLNFYQSSIFCQSKPSHQSSWWLFTGSYLLSGGRGKESVCLSWLSVSSEFGPQGELLAFMTFTLNVSSQKELFKFWLRALLLSLFPPCRRSKVQALRSHWECVPDVLPSLVFLFQVSLICFL